MTDLRPVRSLALILVAAVSVSAGRPASASGRVLSPAILLAQQDPGDDTGDPSALVLRIGRLEEQIRTLTGQIEQLQFQNKRLDDNLRKMQGDVDFRLQDLEHGTGAPGGSAPRAAVPLKRGDVDGAPPADAVAGAPPAAASTEPARAAPTRRASGDAFDPDADPTAPGAPRPLGTTAASQPLDARTNRVAAAGGSRGAPLDLMHTQADPVAPDDAAAPPPVIAAPAQARDATSVASLAPGGTREEYDADLGLYKQGQFDGAASGFQSFAEKYPKDRLVPDAIFLAGESYAKLGRQREAAEQFLKVSTDYGKSPRAADALLRLGMSLNALGAKDQACATYLEVNRRYPAASADVHTAVDRELKRARCPANG